MNDEKVGDEMQFGPPVHLTPFMMEGRLAMLQERIEADERPIVGFVCIVCHEDGDHTLMAEGSGMEITSGLLYELQVFMRYLPDDVQAKLLISAFGPLVARLQSTAEPPTERPN